MKINMEATLDTSKWY